MSSSVDNEFRIIHKLPSNYRFTNQKENGSIQDPILLETISSFDDKKSSILIESSSPLLGTLFKPSGIKQLIHMVLDEHISSPTEEEFKTTLDNHWSEIQNPLTRESIFSSSQSKRNSQIDYYWKNLYEGTEDDGSTEPRRSMRLSGKGGKRKKRSKQKTNKHKTKRRRTKKRKTKMRRKTRRRKYK